MQRVEIKFRIRPSSSSSGVTYVLRCVILGDGNDSYTKEERERERVNMSTVEDSTSGCKLAISDTRDSN